LIGHPNSDTDDTSNTNPLTWPLMARTCFTCQPSVAEQNLHVREGVFAVPRNDLLPLGAAELKTEFSSHVNFARGKWIGSHVA